MNILQFEAKLLKSRLIVNERKFMIPFYYCDDSVIGFENAQRDSGGRPANTKSETNSTKLKD